MLDLNTCIGVQKKYLFLIIISIFFSCFINFPYLWQFSIYIKILLFLTVCPSVSTLFSFFLLLSLFFTSSSRVSYCFYWKCMAEVTAAKGKKKKKIFEFFLTPYKAYIGFFIVLKCFVEIYCDLWHVSQV